MVDAAKKNQAQLLQNYADALTGGGYTNANADRVGDEMIAFGRDAGVNVYGICNVADTQSASSISTFLGQDEGFVSSDTNDTVVNRLGEWHQKLAGGFASELELMGYSVDDVKLGKERDTFTVSLNGHSVAVSIIPEVGTKQTLDHLQHLTEILSNDALGGIESCSYVPGWDPDTFDFHMEDGTTIHLNSSQNIGVEDFSYANSVRNVLSEDDRCNWLIGNYNIHDDGSLSVTVYVGENTYDVFCDPASMGRADILLAFEEGFEAATGYRLEDAESHVDDGEKSAPPTQRAAASGGESGGNKTESLDGIPAAWVNATPAGRDAMMQQIFTALNANGGTPEGKAQNLKGIEILGKLAGSEKAASILSQIAINAAKPDSGYNPEYSQAAHNALVALKNASPGNAKIAQFADDIDKKIT